MISTIAVGTDGSGTAAEAVKTAADLARKYGAKLVLVSAFQGSEGSGKGPQWRFRRARVGGEHVGPGARDPRPDRS